MLETTAAPTRPHVVAKLNDAFPNINAATHARSPKTACFQHAREESQGRSSEYWNKKSSRLS
jgi:hypothetical protein